MPAFVTVESDRRTSEGFGGDHEHRQRHACSLRLVRVSYAAMRSRHPDTSVLEGVAEAAEHALVTVLLDRGDRVLLVAHRRQLLEQLGLLVVELRRGLDDDV